MLARLNTGLNNMPELPEVEVTKRGLYSKLKGAYINSVIIREARLRWPVSLELDSLLHQKTLLNISRRGKYLLFHLENGCLIAHLGMSGSFKIVSPNETLRPHDHIDILFSNGCCLRYHDPRRFGCLLWHEDEQHPLLAQLGVEPLQVEFNPIYLQQVLQNKRIPIKQAIMDNKIVVGVGNIYANEALFMAKIHPLTPARHIQSQQFAALVIFIKQILNAAIDMGGTTLRDFSDSSGKMGYFQQELHVYGKNGQLCSCKRAKIEKITIGQRSSFFCPACQTLNLN